MKVKSDYRELEERIGYNFKKKNLLYTALTHSSYSNESKNLYSMNNERLEFLGDAVLELIISEFLYKKYPRLAEGELTKMRAKIVCSESLSEIALELNIGNSIMMGKGEELQGGRERKSVLANAMEAIIGAVYLDSELDITRDFVIMKLKSIIKNVENGKVSKDYKTILQEKVQSEKNKELYYKLIKEEGPDHNKLFYVDVIINNKRVASGKGRNKKEAEQDAARGAIEYIEGF